MKHTTLADLKSVAEVKTQPWPSRALRRERLERFATALERHTGFVSLLPRIEYLSPEELLQVRSDRSVLTVAFQDPVLRVQGLAGDRLGDAMFFFGLSRQEAHYLFCDCHFAGPVSAQTIAHRVRAVASHVSLRERWQNLTSRIRAWWSGRHATAG